MLVKHFYGEPKIEDLQLIEEDLSTELEENGSYLILKI